MVTDELLFTLQAPQSLRAGMRLRAGRVLDVVGGGPTGFVYRVHDEALGPIAVREYFPHALATRIDGMVRPLEGFEAAFNDGLKLFDEDGWQLAAQDHPGLLKVQQVWSERGTSYVAMPWCDGRTLSHRLRMATEPPAQEQLCNWLRAVADALTLVHRRRGLHGHLSPEQVMLLNSGRLLVMEFSRARRVVARDPRDIERDPFAALECGTDPRHGPTGPWTDVYALAAMLYFALCGRPPQAAVRRAAFDALEPLAQNPSLIEAGYSEEFLSGIDSGLELRARSRPQSLPEFLLRAGVRDRRSRQRAIGESLLSNLPVGDVPAGPGGPEATPDDPAAANAAAAAATAPDAEAATDAGVNAAPEAKAAAGPEDDRPAARAASPEAGEEAANEATQEAAREAAQQAAQASAQRASQDVAQPAVGQMSAASAPETTSDTISAAVPEVVAEASATPPTAAAAAATGAAQTAEVSAPTVSPEPSAPLKKPAPVEPVAAADGEAQPSTAAPTAAPDRAAAASDVPPAAFRPAATPRPAVNVPPTLDDIASPPVAKAAQEPAAPPHPGEAATERPSEAAKAPNVAAQAAAEAEAFWGDDDEAIDSVWPGSAPAPIVLRKRSYVDVAKGLVWLVGAGAIAAGAGFWGLSLLGADVVVELPANPPRPAVPVTAPMTMPPPPVASTPEPAAATAPTVSPTVDAAALPSTGASAAAPAVEASAAPVEPARPATEPTVATPPTLGETKPAVMPDAERPPAPAAANRPAATQGPATEAKPTAPAARKTPTNPATVTATGPTLAEARPTAAAATPEPVAAPADGLSALSPRCPELLARQYTGRPLDASEREFLRTQCRP